MKFPYFTMIDPFLMRSGGGRDPLGLQPVWSAYGRALVPNIATPVGKVDGIKAVLVIHWLAEKEFASLFSSQQKRSFRGYFRLMEGLWEYFLAPSDRGGECFGTRSLAAEGEEFWVTSDDTRTVANGLYQYYRGTCRRAALLREDWSVPDDVGASLARCWDRKGIAALRNALDEPLSDRRSRLVPALVLSRNSALLDALKNTVASEELTALLQGRLLGEPCHVAVARQCALLLETDADQGGQGWTKWCTGQLVQWLDRESGLGSRLQEPLGNLLLCEPFLLILQDFFDYLLASPGAKLSAVHGELSGYDSFVGERARRFLRLQKPVNGARLEQMLALAQAATSGGEALMQQLLQHHARCMKDRNRDPLVQLDNDTVVVPGAAERSKTEILGRMHASQPWDNGYYLYNAGLIYRQLFGGRHG